MYSNIILHIIFVGQASSADKNGLVFQLWSLVIISFLFGRLFVFFLHFLSTCKYVIRSFIIYIEIERYKYETSGRFRFGTLEKSF